MAKSDWLLVIVTAIVGFASGFYLYSMVFAPTYVAHDPEIETDSELTIIGEFYGGCTPTCPSFRLTSNRSYQYLPQGVETTGGAVTDRYPRVVFYELERAIAKSNLTAASKRITKTACDSYSGGLDARFVVTYNTTEYEFDTCRTALDTDRALTHALIGIFDVLADPAEFSYGAEEYQKAGVIGYILPEAYDRWLDDWGK